MLNSGMHNKYDGIGGPGMNGDGIESPENILICSLPLLENTDWGISTSIHLHSAQALYLTDQVHSIPVSRLSCVCSPSASRKHRNYFLFFFASREHSVSFFRSVCGIEKKIEPASFVR